ncbi:S66 peptidase family protein [Bacillus subtilis]
MIKYPIFNSNVTIGVTAPSSGVKQELHDMLTFSCNRMKDKGYNIICGETIWTQIKAKADTAQNRAEEFNKMMQDENIDIIIPPWGGELLIEILEFIDFDNIKSKWILGYSDISTLLLAVTLKTGIATAHGSNLIDLRGEFSDNTTAMWETVLATKNGESITQYSSSKYQSEWKEVPSPCVFHLNKNTCWKTSGEKNVRLKGRLLGGCIDTIRHLVGTPYGDVESFRKEFINSDSVIWYLENCDLNTADLRRSLVQMKFAGWFKNCSGIMFGRSSANEPVDNYLIEDVYKELSNELKLPVVFDIDCGHVPPQMTLVNGAYAEVEVFDGKGIIHQYFK